jgi:hypothetical protein
MRWAFSTTSLWRRGSPRSNKVISTNTSCLLKFVWFRRFSFPPLDPRYTSASSATPRGITKFSLAATYRISCEGHQGIPSGPLRKRRREYNMARRGRSKLDRRVRSPTRSGFQTLTIAVGSPTSFCLFTFFTGVRHPGFIWFCLFKNCTGASCVEPGGSSPGLHLSTCVQRICANQVPRVA